MKKLTKIFAICLLLVPFFNLKAQENALLKSFINKNDVAVRSVQKYSINISDQTNEINFKEILKLQLASVKLFSSDPGKSANVAFMVREKCSEFLNAHANKGSLEYLKLSDKEHSFFSSPKPVEKAASALNATELQKINSIDTKDAHLFDDLNSTLK